MAARSKNNIKRRKNQKKNAGNSIPTVRHMTRGAAKKNEVKPRKIKDGCYTVVVNNSCLCKSPEEITRRCPIHDHRGTRNFVPIREMIEKMSVIHIQEPYEAHVPERETVVLDISIQDIVEDNEFQLYKKMRIEKTDVCIICDEIVYDVDLYLCEVENCTTQFHLDCILYYGDAGYRLPYLARAEVAGMLCCPLHFCHHCMELGRKRHTASAGDLVECIKCLRAWHSTCEPAGSKMIMFNEKKMLICPAHTDERANPIDYNGDHLDHCFECTTKTSIYPIIECQYCPRITHTECRDEMLDSCRVEDQKTDFRMCLRCARCCAVRANRICLYSEGQGLKFGVSQSWEKEKAQRAKGVQKLGHVLIQKWSKAQRRLSTDFVIVREKQVVEMTKLAIEHHFDGGDDFGILDFVKDHAERMAPKKPKYTRKLEWTDNDVWKTFQKTLILPEFKICKNILRKDKKPQYFCPEGCKGPLGVRCIRQFHFKNKARIGDTLYKGKGIFATCDIGKYELITKFSGEVIEEAEYDRIQKVLKEGNDLEEEKYAVDHEKGLVMESNVCGDKGRYANFSHDPNAAFMFYYYPARKNEEGDIVYVPMVAIQAVTPIKEKEEIVVDYGKLYDIPSPCFCEAKNCPDRKQPTTA